jgi:hypothetical protein
MVEKIQHAVIAAVEENVDEKGVDVESKSFK